MKIITEKFDFYSKVFRSLIFAPLLSGALIGGKVVGFYYFEFLVVVGFLLLNSYFDFARRKQWRSRLVFVGVEVGLLVLWYSLIGNLWGVGLLIFAGILLQLFDRIEQMTNLKSLFIKQGLLVGLMSILPGLGILTQHHKLFWQIGVLGLLPGFMLAAGLVIDSAEMLESLGWKRSKVVINRKGQEIRRPGGVAQLFVGLLVLGPMIVISMTLLGNLLPNSFALVALVLTQMPNLANDFLDHKMNDQKISQTVIKLTAWTSIGIFIIGIMQQ